MNHRDIDYIMDAHSNHPRKESKAFRKWDGKTPYYIHPLWCATTIAAETKLDDRTREEGVLTLLYHDILEDTTKDLPSWLDERIKQLIQMMTYEGIVEEINKIWKKPKEIRLYKLYDKVNNLLDWQQSSVIKHERYKEYTRRLCEDVRRNFGELNITRIAEAIQNN